MESLPPLNPFNVKIGAWLKAKREAAGLSLAEVSKTFRIEPLFLEQIEQGQKGLPMKVLEQLRRHYHCSPGELMKIIMDARRR